MIEALAVSAVLDWTLRRDKDGNLQHGHGRSQSKRDPTQIPPIIQL